MVNDWHGEWDALPLAEQAAKKSRQGVRYPVLEALDVRDPDTHDAGAARRRRRMGEVMMRGNVVMQGLSEEQGSRPTRPSRAAGSHTGDLGVMYPDGYIQLKDRSKDIIISGGENISSIEVEDALYKHPAVAGRRCRRQAGRQMGRDALRLRRTQARRERDARRDLSRGARRSSRATRCRATSCSAKCRRPATGKIQKFKLRDVAKES